MPGSKPRRSALGSDPLDSLLGGSSADTGDAPAARAPTKAAAATRPPKARATFQIDGALYEQMRDAVIHLSGPPDRLTLNGFAEEAFRRELDRLRAEHMKGRAFPKREAELRPGRPLRG